MASRLRRLGAALAALAVLAAGTVRAGPPRPHRIVSLNVCADQYLIALADKDQVAALTQLARDPAFSFYAQAAKAYPVAPGEAEAVLALRPDLVILGPYRQLGALAILRGKARILELAPADSFAEVVAQTRLVAAAIGQRARGEALIRAMQARVAAAGRAPLGGVAADYQRGGFLSGPGTLMDDLMARAGLVNLARRLNGGALGRLSLEQIVYDRPDFLILSEGATSGEDEGGQLLDHPALERAVPPARRLYLPSALTACGGPSYPAALERLQAEAARARRLAPPAGHPG